MEMKNKQRVFTVILSSLVSVFLVAGAVMATTTVGLNINTGGTADIESYAAVGNGSALSANNGLIVDYDATYTGVGAQVKVLGTVTGAAATNVYGVQIAPESMTIPTGTTAIAASLYVNEPVLTATGTVTNASTVYIAGAPTEGTNNYALFAQGPVTIGADVGATGVTLNGTTNPDYGLQTHARIAAAVGNAAYSSNYTTMTVTASQSGNQSIFGSWSELYLTGDITLASSNFGAVWGNLEIADGGGSFTFGGGSAWAGALIATLISPDGMVIDSGRDVAGVIVDSNITASYTNNGTLSGIAIRKSGSSAAWPVGLTILDSATTTGIDVGTATTGIALTGTQTTGIDMSSGTIATDITLSESATIVSTDANTLTITEPTIALVGTTAITLDGGGTSTYAIGGSITSGTITIGAAAQTGATVIYGGSTTNAVQVNANVGAVASEAHGLDVVVDGELSSGDNLVGINAVVTPTGTAATWTAGVFGNVTQGATKTTNGYITGGEFEVINACSTASGIFPITLDAGGSVAYDAQSSFIFLNDWGTSKLGSLLRFGDASSPYTGSDTAIFTTKAGEAPAATHAIRFVGPDNTPYWIMVTTDTPAD